MDIVTVILEGLRVIFGFILLLFIPGFFISLVFFPRFSEIGIVERLVYSTVLSIGSVIVLVLFMDVFLGINTKPLNIFLAIAAFSYFVFFIWLCEIYYLRKRENKQFEPAPVVGGYRISIQNFDKRLRDSIGSRFRRKP